jgi:hypothetical protein
VFANYTSIQRIFTGTGYCSIRDRHTIVFAFAILHQGANVGAGESCGSNCETTVSKSIHGTLKTICGDVLENREDEKAVRKRSGHCWTSSSGLGIT